MSRNKRKEWKKVKIPKMTREQNGSCKLTDSDINKIRDLRFQGHSFYRIAAEFKIGVATAFYWCQDDEYRKALARKTRKDRYTREEKRIFNKKTYNKKKALYRKEVLEYNKMKSREYRYGKK